MRCEGCWRLRCNTDAERASRVSALQQQARRIAWRGGAELSAGRFLEAADLLQNCVAEIICIRLKHN